jgi:O-acetyl-ADP-ribose deacetylase (regulator of RNase III)
MTHNVIEVKGDLIQMAEDGELDVIVHGANCFDTMNSGIAGQLARKYPQVAAVDRATKRGDRTKLGGSTFVEIARPDGTEFVVYNAYTQYRFGGGEDLFEYEAFDLFLEDLLSRVKELALIGGDNPLRIGFPWIGAGLAGGDWSRIKASIVAFAEKAAPEAKVTIVEFCKGASVMFGRSEKQFHCELPDDMAIGLRRLENLTGFGRMAIFRKAYRLYFCLKFLQEDGGQVILRDKDGKDTFLTGY